MLLLHEFHRRKFMTPDKLKSKDRERLTKAAARVQQMAEEGYIPEEEDKPGRYSISYISAPQEICYRIMNARKLTVRQSK